MATEGGEIDESLRQNHQVLQFILKGLQWYTGQSQAKTEEFESLVLSLLGACYSGNYSSR